MVLLRIVAIEVRDQYVPNLSAGFSKAIQSAPVVLELGYMASLRGSKIRTMVRKLCQDE